MKKIFSLALIAFSVFSSVSARADEPLKFGLKAGLNVSDFHFSSDVFDKTNQAGWSGNGCFGTLRLPFCQARL